MVMFQSRLWVNILDAKIMKRRWDRLVRRYIKRVHTNKQSLQLQYMTPIPTVSFVGMGNYKHVVEDELGTTED